MIILLSVFGILNSAFQFVKFVRDPYAIYLLAKEVRTTFQKVETSPLFIEADGWELVEDWELVEIKHLFI